MNLSLTWRGGLAFEQGDAGPPIALDSSSPDVVSPVQALCYALMGCMAMDVVYVIQKGRHELRAMAVSLDAVRAPDPPRRLVAVRMHFDVTGDVPDAVVERAIELSRTTYCSVWNSLRQDIELNTTFATRA